MPTHMSDHTSLTRDGNFEEVIDWVALSAGNRRVQQRSAARGRRAEKVFSLKVVEDKTITVPIGSAVLPHSEGRREGLVTVRTTPYSSIQIPQRMAAPETCVSPTQHEMKRMLQRGYVRQASPRQQRSSRAPSAAGQHVSDPALAQSPLSEGFPPPPPSSRRDRRVLSMLAAGAIRGVRELPLPELFNDWD